MLPALAGTMRSRWLAVLWWLLLAGASASPLQCCESGVDWKGKSDKCKDGNRVRLHCPMGLYAVDSIEDPDEQYRVDATSGWLQAVDRQRKLLYDVAPSNFCETRVGSASKYLICFGEEAEQSSSKPAWLTTFFGLCGMLSSVFLALTLLVYLVLPELRELQDKAAMCVCASFMLAFFLNANQNLNFPARLQDDLLCLLTAFLMYYAYLCAFFWLNVISLNICRAVWFPSLKVRSNVLFVVYCVLGWGVPLCFLAFALVGHNVHGIYTSPGFGETSCWFRENSATWLYFYGPILALLSMNLLYLALTSWKLWHSYKHLHSCRIKVLRVKCAMYVKLALMMGATWIFEVVSFAFGDSNALYWILTDILNVLQGLFIFVLFVLWRKKVRKLLAERRPFNIPFPKSWAAYKDQERCEENVEDELELSQTS